MSTALEPTPPRWNVWSIPDGAELAGRYRIRERLGEGAMACVYRAVDEVAQAQVALKVLDPFRAADPVGRARFEQEFSLLSRLSHAGVARSLRTAHDGELEILVLEFLEGETLEARLRRGPLAVTEALQIGQQLAEAVAACHDQGILHRDLKPANIMLHPDRGPVVFDFGVAWFGAGHTAAHPHIVGSPQYIAPEVLETSLADPRADVFALGVILFEMLTGAPPPHDDASPRHSRARRPEPPSAFSLRPEVGPDLSAVVGRAMALRAEARYATAAELGAALRRPTLNAGRSLEARRPCPRCSTRRIVDLPICPGCGAEVGWVLTRGGYAVQLDHVPDVHAAAGWLFRRHRKLLGFDTLSAARRQLRRPPIVLASGICKLSADQLVDEARELGIEVTVVNQRRLSGPGLRAREASMAEALAVLGAHLIATLLIGTAFHSLGWGPHFLFAAPAVAGVLGLAVVRAYSRRPLLQLGRVRRSPVLLDMRVRALCSTLSALRHERSRQLAAQAFSRAAPVLTSSWAPRDLKDEIVRLLTEAVEAIGRADAHQRFLLEHRDKEWGRTLQSHDADPDEAERTARDAKKRDLTEAAVAYDVEVRTALETCQHMSALAATQSAT